MGITAKARLSEVGLIPEDWLDPQLQEVADQASPICYGIVQVGPFVPNGIPVLAIKNLGLDYTTNIHRASERVEAPYLRSRVRPDDVVVSVKGTTGRIGIVPHHFQGNISRDLARVRPRANVAPQFLFQVLKSELAQRRLTNATVGTTRMELSIATLKEVRVPLPPTRREQAAIAGVLSDADALIESLEQLLAKKRHLRQGAMQELLTGTKRLAGLAVERGCERSACGPIPRGWQTLPMSSLFSLQNGVNADKAAYGVGIPFINVLEVITHSRLTTSKIPGRVMLSEHSIEAFEVRSGDVLFNRTSETQEEVGLASVYLGSERVVFGGFVIRGRPHSELLDPLFASYQLRSRLVRSQIVARGQGVVRANIGQRDLYRVHVPLPPMTEQTAIAEVLSDMDAETAALEAKLTKARQIKQGMMQELLTGRIRLV